MSIVVRNVEQLFQQLSLLPTDLIHFRRPTASGPTKDYAIAVQDLIASLAGSTSDEISNIFSVINAEVQDRTSVDNVTSVAIAALFDNISALADNIDNETSDRISVDDSLSNVISGLYDTISADNDLLSNLTSAHDDLSNRVSANSSTGGGDGGGGGSVTSNELSNSVSILSQAISVISQSLSIGQANLSSRIDTQSNSVSVVSQSLSIEIVNRISANNVLSNNISNNASIISQELSVVSQVLSLYSQQISILSQGVSVISNALSNEISNRISADNTISNSLSNSLSAVSNSLSILSNFVSSQVAGSSALIVAIANVVSIETVNRISAGNIYSQNLSVVSNALSNEISNRGSAINVVSNALSNEISNRISVGNALSNSLSNEISNRGSAITHFAMKPMAVYATNSALPAFTYNNGVAGVGATITANVNGLLTINGSIVVLGDTILVRSEPSGPGTASPYQGLYVCTDGGGLGSPFILTRHSSMNIPSDFTGYPVIPVTVGVQNIDSTLFYEGFFAGQIDTLSLPFIIGTNGIAFHDWGVSRDYVDDLKSYFVTSVINALSQQLSVQSTTISNNASIVSQGLSLLSQGISVVSQAHSALSQVVSVMSTTISQLNSVVSQGLSLNSQKVSVLSQNISVVSNALSNEISNRGSAINVVSNALSNEISNRISAANLLSNSISQLQSIHDTLSNRVSANSAVAGGSVTSTKLSNFQSNVLSQLSVISSYISINFGNQISIVSQNISVVSVAAATLSNAVSNTTSAKDVLSQAISVLSQQVSVLSQAMSIMSQNISATGGIQNMAFTSTVPYVVSAATLTNIPSASMSGTGGGIYQINGGAIFECGTSGGFAFGFSLPALAPGGSYIEMNMASAGNTQNAGAIGAVPVFSYATFSALAAQQTALISVSVAVINTLKYMKFEGLVAFSTTGTVQLMAKTSVAGASMSVRSAWIRAIKVG